MKKLKVLKPCSTVSEFHSNVLIDFQSCVHVSTAFSNSDKRVVEEKVYKPKYDAHAVINLVENLPDEVVESLSSKLMASYRR